MRFTSLQAVRGVDSRFKLQSPHHQHHNQNQSVDDESASCSPHCHSMVNQSYPRQLVAISSTSFPGMLALDMLLKSNYNISKPRQKFERDATCFSHFLDNLKCLATFLDKESDCCWDRFIFNRNPGIADWSFQAFCKLFFSVIQGSLYPFVNFSFGIS